MSTRFGDSLSVTGSGTSTKIIAGSASGSSSTVAVFTTGNGMTFSSTKLTIAGTGGSDFSKGIAFGPNGTIFGRQTSTSLRQADRKSTTGTLLGSYTLNSISATVGPIAYDPVHGLLAGIEVSASAGATQRVNLYDVNTLSTTSGGKPAGGVVHHSQFRRMRMRIKWEIWNSARMARRCLRWILIMDCWLLPLRPSLRRLHCRWWGGVALWEHLPCAGGLRSKPDC